MAKTKFQIAEYQRGVRDAKRGVQPPLQALTMARLMRTGYLKGWMDTKEKRRK